MLPQSLHQVRKRGPHVRVGISTDKRLTACKFGLNIGEALCEPSALGAGLVVAPTPNEKWHLVIKSDRL